MKVLRDPRARSLFGLLFTLMFAVILGDNVSESLLLSFFPVEKLPLMFMANSAGLFLVSLFIMGGIDRVSRMTFFTVVSLSVTAVLLILRLLAGLGFEQAYLLLFSFAYVGKILLFLAFWTVANDLCDSREAKSIFPIIGAGGVLGGVLSCFLTGYLGKTLGPGPLLYLWMGLLVASTLQMGNLYGRHKRELSVEKRNDKRKGPSLLSIRDNLQMVAQEPLLRTMAILYFGLFFLLISLDFHFFSLLQQTLSAKLEATSVGSRTPGELGKEISSFLGYFRGLAGTSTFLIQITLSGLILRKLGTARSMYILPLAFSLVFLLALLQSAMGILPGGLESLPLPFSHTLFLIVLAGTCARIALFDSLFSPNFQIFFSSLSPAIRAKGKMFLEGLLKPIAISLAGLSTWLVETQLLRKAPELLWVHFLILFLIGICLLIMVRRQLKGAYAASLSGTLGKGKFDHINASWLRLRSQGFASLKTLLEPRLRDPDPGIRALAIETLAGLDDPAARELLLLRMKSHDGPDRAFILRALSRKGASVFGNEDEFCAALDTWLSDSDERVVEVAVDMCAMAPADIASEKLWPFLLHRNPKVSTRAIAALWWVGNEGIQAHIHQLLPYLLSRGKEENARAVMKICAEIGEEALLPYLRRTWRQLERALHERHSDPEEIGDLKVTYLSCLGRIQSLAASMEMLEGCLSLRYRQKALLFETMKVHCHLWRERIGELTGELKRDSRRMLFHMLFVARVDLNHAQRRLMQNHLEEEISWAFSLFMASDSLREGKPYHVELLLPAVREGPLASALQSLTHLLALCDPSGRLNYSAPKLLSSSKFERAAACEAVETVLSHRLRKLILPLFSADEAPQELRLGAESLGYARMELQEALSLWESMQEFPWTSACALYCRMQESGSSVGREEELKNLSRLVHG